MGIVATRGHDAADPAQPRPGLPRVTLTQAAVRPVIDHVLPGLPAGSVGLIVGQGAVGKSLLALAIAEAIASGRRVAGMWTPPSTGPVTVVMGEDAPDILQERLYWLREAYQIDEHEAADTDERLTVLSGMGYDLRVMAMEGTWTAEGPWYADLRRMAEGQRLVILDPMRFLHDADENHNGQMTRFMRLLQQVARATGCTIIVLHHVSKSGAGEREDWTAASGAGAITTAARWQVSMRPMSPKEAEDAGIAPDLRRQWARVAVDKINYGEQPPPVMIRRGRGGILHADQTPAESGEVQRVAAQYERRSNGGGGYGPSDY